MQQIWRACGLQPHRSETFTLSTDPLLVEKVRDIVGLYLHPPTDAVVVCVDEKSKIQALDRTQPVLPMRPGQIERRTHHYRRHGTTTLCAALNVKTSDHHAVIAAHHANPKPFTWTKTADEILVNIARFAQRTLDFQTAPLIQRTTRSGH